ncbi:unnamed protein product [Haemonchus placei]|uniref:Transposase n=1 Tax=Haemonchus placei TaxID=6290 RepID=A0A0N4WV05_HAEPC|nr:unnamed protein product [Haemonchus placei]
MKNGKAPGPEQIRPEHLKCLQEDLAKRIIPKDWLSSHTILIYKKGV